MRTFRLNWQIAWPGLKCRLTGSHNTATSSFGHDVVFCSYCHEFTIRPGYANAIYYARIRTL